MPRTYAAPTIDAVLDGSASLADYFKRSPVVDEDTSKRQPVEERQAAFLVALQSEPTLVDACRATGTSRWTVWHWRKHSEVFDSAVTRILDAVQADVHEQIEHSVWKSALAGNVLHQMFVLKRFDHRYRDNHKPAPPGHRQQAPEGTPDSITAWQEMVAALGLADMTADLPQLPASSDGQDGLYPNGNGAG